MFKNLLFVAAAMIVVLLIVVFFLLQTRSIESDEGLPVKIYFADNISPAHQLVIDRFNQMHRGSIEIVPVNLPFDKFSTNERKELLARSLRNKSDRIDVFAVDLIWVPRFSKWAEPPGHFFRKDELSRLLGYALESCYFESTLVAIPLYLDIGMMYYRRDLLRKIPNYESIETQLKQSMPWDDFLALKGKPELQGKPFYAFPAKDYEGLVCNYFELIAGRTHSRDNNHLVDLTTPEAHSALQMLVDFVNKDGVSPREMTDFDENQSYTYMLEHDGVFWRGWPNFVENYSTFYPDKEKIRNIGRAALPRFKDMPARSVFGGWNLMVSKYSNHKPQALEFIKYLCTETTQRTMFEVGGYLPANRNVYDDTTYIRKHPDLVYYRQLLDRGFHRPALKEYTRISDIISHYVHRAIKGEIRVHEALQRASHAITSSRIPIE